MVVIGALVNGLAAAVGGLIGMGLKRHLSQELADFLMVALGLAVVLTGITGLVGAGNVLLTTCALCVGATIGHVLDLDGAVRRLGDRVQARFDRFAADNPAFADVSSGFVGATLVVCVGAMAIVGSLAAGLRGDQSTLYTKALMDLVICVPMGATLGVGVVLSGVAAFVYEGALTLGAAWLAPLLSEAVINEMLVCGSLLLFAIGLNFMRVTEIKVANLLPAVFLPVALVPLFAALGM